MFPKKKWCFSKSGNNRFTPVIYPAGYPQPENFSTVVFNSQGPDHRYNPLTILLNSWILPVSANCQQNKSGTVHRLLIIEETRSWGIRVFLRLLKVRPCHPPVPLSSAIPPGEYPLVKSLELWGYEDEKLKNWIFLWWYRQFFSEEWKSKHQDPYRKVGTIQSAPYFCCRSIKSPIVVLFLK